MSWSDNWINGYPFSRPNKGHQGPFYKRELFIITRWINNYIYYKVWDEITYPFPNFHGTAKLFGPELSFERILVYCHLNNWEQPSVKLESQYEGLRSEKILLNMS